MNSGRQLAGGGGERDHQPGTERHEKQAGKASRGAGGPPSHFHRYAQRTAQKKCVLSRFHDSKNHSEFDYSSGMADSSWNNEKKSIIAYIPAQCIINY